MRTITVIISLFITLAFLGCRESLVSQPESPVNVEKSTPYNEDLIKGEINICCPSYDPYSGDCKVMGKVTYQHNIIGYSSNNARVKLDLEMDAELCTKLMNPVRYTIYGSCCDTLLLINGKLLLDKTYSVEYRPDLRFCVQFSITNESVSIIQMNLLQMVDPD